jgi:hypothetical protein
VHRLYFLYVAYIYPLIKLIPHLLKAQVNNESSIVIPKDIITSKCAIKGKNVTKALKLRKIVTSVSDTPVGNDAVGRSAASPFIKVATILRIADNIIYVIF